MAPKFSKPQICSLCHRAGHRAFECPTRSDTKDTTDTPRPRRPPPHACWTCGEMHWSDECKEQQERKERGACLICGETDHWIKACPMYESKVGKAAPAPPADNLWCLRCGTSDHATVKCQTRDPPIHFPDPDDLTKRGCLYCGLFGHDMNECLRRVPSVQNEQSQRLLAIASDQDDQSTAIKQLQSDVKALQASHKVIDECKTDLAELHTKVDRLMTFQQAAEPQIATSSKICANFQQFLNNDWVPHKRQFQNFLDEEWQPVKHRFEDLLQKDLDGPRTKESRQAVNVDSSPELPGPPEDDVAMSPARTTGKRTAADRTGPPTTPAAKRKSDSGSSSRRWWVDLDPLSLDQAPKAWHKDLLEALLTEWGDHNMLRLQQWMATHGTEEMKTTLDSLSTSNTTTRQLHSGLRTLLRGACVPPLIFGATAPKGRVSLASSSLNDLAKSRH